jgi:hypothetical protein
MLARYLAYYGGIMKHFVISRMFFLSIIFLFLSTCLTPLSSPQLVSHIVSQRTETLNGQILFAPINYGTTYLIDNTGAVNHTWSSNYLPGESVRWLGDGTILRTIKTEVHGYGGVGGGVQKVLWNGTVVWDFRYNTNGDLSHHDIMPLPNGNVLMIAWETKTRAEVIEAGRDPNSFIGDTFMPDHIIEVKPTGPTGGTIVWEWHVWDHLIQDYDPSKANYGVIADHPELIDINYGYNPVISDWTHTNSIDYNEEFDQILISVRNFNEIWVIDHSTTTEEAAGHTGGDSGKGGDLLYRWGNPIAYGAGTTSDKKLFSQHDASWIDQGLPGEGDIIVFNNGDNRPSGAYSSVDEMIPPINDEGKYYLEPGSSFGPKNLTWTYTADPPLSFYSGLFSGAQRLADGDTLICDAVDGRFFEVTPDGATLWQYINPFPGPNMNAVFKIVYIPPVEPPEPGVPDLACTGSLSWTDITPGQTVNGNVRVENIGAPGSLLNWTINVSSITWGTWSCTPGDGENLTPEDGQVTVNISIIAPDEKNSIFEGYLRVENTGDPQDFEVVPVYLQTPKSAVFMFQSFLLHKILDWFPNAFPVLRHLLRR